MYRYRLLLTATICFIVIGSNAQQSIIKVLDRLNAEFPQEKLHLHLDRGNYKKGETIWFKAYAFSGNTASNISRTMYADLYDAKGNLLDHKSMPLMNSTASSYLKIPDDVLSSVVYIRAYTEYMRNFDSSFFYTQPVALHASKFSTSPQSGISLQFFPEGGQLIDGIKTSIAFRATYENGLPYNVTGELVNEENKLITSFSAIHDGMGSMVLRPYLQKKYTAVWKNNKGIEQRTPLPEIKKAGLALSVERSPETIDYFLESKSTPSENYSGEVTIVAQMHQQLLYMANANFSSNKKVGGSIPVKDIPAGIVQIAILSETNELLAERLVFNKQADYSFTPQVEMSPLNFDKRAQNNFTIEIPEAIQTSLSVSVTDAETNNGHTAGLLENILLASDIREYIHQPGYYFNAQEDAAGKHLDLLMLTSKWNRFSWENVLAGNFPEIKYPIQNYLSFTGNVSGLSKKKSSEPTSFTGILESDNDKKILMITLDSLNNFRLSGLIFYDNAKLYSDLKKFNRKNTPSIMSVEPATEDTPQEWEPDHALLARNNLPDTIQGNLPQHAEVLGTVTKKAYKPAAAPSGDEYSTGVFAGSNGRVIYSDNNSQLNSGLRIIEYLLSNVGGLQRENNSISIKGSVTYLFLDQVRTDLSQLENLSTNEIGLIKVFAPPFVGAPLNAGAIVVYTKKGRQNISTASEFATLRGYSPKGVFTHPEKETHDYPTLYWNPDILLDKNNRKIPISFLNNDYARAFRLVIEGFNEAGKLIRVEKILKP